MSSKAEALLVEIILNKYRSYNLWGVLQEMEGQVSERRPTSTTRQYLFLLAKFLGLPQSPPQHYS